MYNPTSLLAGSRVQFGYNMRHKWDDPIAKEGLQLCSVTLIDPERDIAGLVDVVSNCLLSTSQTNFTVAFTNSADNSISSERRADLTFVDVFHTKQDASDLYALLLLIQNHAPKTELEWIKYYDQMTPDEIFKPYLWVEYRNNGQQRMVDLSYLDGIFERIDGVWLFEIEPSMLHGIDF